MAQRIYFISDAHLGAGDPASERRKEDSIVSFLQSLRGQAQALYLVGDLFDFWFEYASVVPRKHARVLFELYRLIADGTKVVYVAGNHDFWVGSYLSEQVGMEVSSHPVEVHHQGVSIYVAHGDGLLARDRAYRLLKKVLRNPVCTALFGLLHPDVGAFLAKIASRLSRWRAKPCRDPFVLDDGYLRAAQEQFARGFDAVVFGHVHHPIHQRSPRTLIVLGDWMRHFSYAVLEDGRFEMRRWEAPGMGQEGSP